MHNPPPTHSTHIHLHPHPKLKSRFVSSYPNSLHGSNVSLRLFHSDTLRVRLAEVFFFNSNATTSSAPCRDPDRDNQTLEANVPTLTRALKSTNALTLHTCKNLTMRWPGSQIGLIVSSATNTIPLADCSGCGQVLGADPSSNMHAHET